MSLASEFKGFKTSSYATIISLLPYKIIEEKPGLIPGRFEIKAAKSLDEPSVLVLRDSFHYVYLDESRGSVPVPDPALKVGTSIAFDYISCQLQRDDRSYPGIAVFPNTTAVLLDDGIKKEQELEEAALKEVKARHSLDLVILKEAQINWYKKLVAFADDDWAMNRRRKNISDLSRYAAKGLGLEREWVTAAPDELVTQQAIKLMKCPGCKNQIDASALVCGHCRVILNKAEWDKLAKASA